MSFPATMKALVKKTPGVSYEYTEVPVIPPVKDELLVKVKKVALCGSDIILYQWNSGEKITVLSARYLAGNRQTNLVPSSIFLLLY